jgi:hypothetical protein
MPKKKSPPEWTRRAKSILWEGAGDKDVIASFSAYFDILPGLGTEGLPLAR